MYLPSLVAFDIFSHLQPHVIDDFKDLFKSRNVRINQHPFSKIARPTTGSQRSSVWGIKTRDF